MQLLRDGLYRRLDLLLAVARGDKEAQTREMLFHRGIKNRLDVNAVLRQRPAEMQTIQRISHDAGHYRGSITVPGIDAIAPAQIEEQAAPILQSFHQLGMCAHLAQRGHRSGSVGRRYANAVDEP